MTDSKDLNKSDQQVSSHDGSTQDTCCICLGDIGNRSTTNACRHSFCFSCIVQWSERTASCPMCRKTFFEIRHDIKDDGTYSSKKLSSLTRDDSDWEAVSEAIFDEWRTLEMELGDSSDSDDDGSEVSDADIAEEEDDGEQQWPIENGRIVEQAEMNVENESASNDDAPAMSDADTAEWEDDGEQQWPIEGGSDWEAVSEAIFDEWRTLEMELGDSSDSDDDDPEVSDADIGDDHANVPSQGGSCSQERLSSSGITTGSKKRPGRDCEDESDNDSDDEVQRPPLKRFKC